MEIETKFHGKINIQQDETWNFPKGMAGFENENEFILLSIEGNDTFQILQSATTPDIAFVVVNPYTLVENYSFDVDEPTIDLLSIEHEQDVFVLGVISLKEPFEKSTINLQAPLIFQKNSRRVKQMILSDSTYTMRHPINKETVVIEGGV